MIKLPVGDSCGLLHEGTGLIQLLEFIGRRAS